MGQYFLKRNKVKTGGSFCCKIIYQLQLNVTQVDGNFSFDDDVMSCHEREGELNKRKDFVKKIMVLEVVANNGGRGGSIA
jgi:hypothetical protein